MKNLNNLQDYIVTDLELAKRILDKYDGDYYNWRKQGMLELQTGVTGHMPRAKAAKHIDWIFFHLKNHL